MVRADRQIATFSFNQTDENGGEDLKSSELATDRKT